MAYVTVKSPIVYYGGKTSILHEIMPLIPIHECYCEPFFGGGAVFFAKEQVKNETINDKLDIVINFYRVLRNNFAALKRMIDATLISRQIHSEGLHYIRAHNKGKKVNPVRLINHGGDSLRENVPTYSSMSVNLYLFLYLATCPPNEYLD